MNYLTFCMFAGMVVTCILNASLAKGTHAFLGWFVACLNALAVLYYMTKEKP